MTQQIRITLAGREDAELVADISRRTFYETFAVHNTAANMDIFLNQQFTREMQMAEVGAPGRIFLLAWLGDVPAGYASLRESPPPPELGGARAIEILQIYSEQKMIGKGVGKALMQRCLEIAREKGKEWVWLGVWEHNNLAIGFYSKWGFERFGEHVFRVGNDEQTDWWMKKKL
jgi:ribosomal protein S18 acetylase RimI-like enzyme